MGKSVQHLALRRSHTPLRCRHQAQGVRKANCDSMTRHEVAVLIPTPVIPYVCKPKKSPHLACLVMGNLWPVGGTKPARRHAVAYLEGVAAGSRLPVRCSFPRFRLRGLMSGLYGQARLRTEIYHSCSLFATEIPLSMQYTDASFD
jgi:hypothetical protein